VEPHNAEGGDGESGADQQEDITISKEALYQAYVAMCGATDSSPLFSRPVVGKMVKRAFPTIQTRRRGPRTNVKQHWIGLRQLTDDELSDDPTGPSHDVAAQLSARAHSSPSSSSSSSFSGSHFFGVLVAPAGFAVFFFVSLVCSASLSSKTCENAFRWSAFCGHTHHRT